MSNRYPSVCILDDFGIENSVTFIISFRPAQQLIALGRHSHPRTGQGHGVAE